MRTRFYSNGTEYFGKRKMAPKGAILVGVRWLCCWIWKRVEIPLFVLQNGGGKGHFKH